MASRVLIVTAAMCVALAGCGGGDVSQAPSTSETVSTTTSTSIPSTTTTTTTTTTPPIDLFREVESYLVDSLRVETKRFVDQQLAEAGLSAFYTVSVDLDRQPVVELEVISQADADALNETVGTVSLFDNSMIFNLLGGGDFGATVPTLSGDETFASFDLPVLYLNAGFLDSLGEFLTELGFPSSTVARMEQTRAVDGTQTIEGDAIVASWTYHPDNGLSVILERR